MTGKAFNKLSKQDKKHERRLDGDIWRHSKAGEPNNVCKSSDFADICLPQYAQGPFALGFANEEAKQEEHHHERHFEAYFSEHSLKAKYRHFKDSKYQSVKLEGGAIIFGPGIIHEMELGGLTMVIEIPSVLKDKVTKESHP